MKNKIEDLDVGNFVKQYNIRNYIFALMNYDDNKLNVHIKTNFNDNKIIQLANKHNIPLYFSKFRFFRH